MAVVQQAPFAMTKMYNVIQQHSPKGGAAKRPLAPAPDRSSVLVNNTSSSADLRCKRKIQFVGYGTGQPQQPASVARRNARERNRVKQVNNGFATLRQHIPASIAAAFTPQGPATGRGASKKLSKVETLRLAVEYIRSLKQMIEDHEGDPSGQSDSRFYGGSPDTSYNSYPILLQTPACSEASQSPTPSEGSSYTSSYTTNTVYSQEAYENDDDEILDAIFSWQQNE